LELIGDVDDDKKYEDDSGEAIKIQQLAKKILSI
jgi:hypothetical protein